MDFPHASRRHRRRLHSFKQQHSLHYGFTLSEVLIAAVLGCGIALVAGTAMIDHLRSSTRIESLQRQRDDWYRATSFIESEVAMSQQVVWPPDKNLASPPSSIDPNLIHPSCSLKPSEIRLALIIRRDLQPILYGIQELPLGQTQWLGEDKAKGKGAAVLIRCGPNIGSGISGDDYLKGSPIRNELIDGLDLAAESNGLFAENKNNSVSFRLSLRNLNSNSNNYKLGSGSSSRINPVLMTPRAGTSCDQVCGANGCPDTDGIVVIGGRFGQPDLLNSRVNESSIVCGLGGNSTAGDTLLGSSGNDTLDAGLGLPGKGALLKGDLGRNFLQGGAGNDSIYGGPQTDTLIGRGGSDLMLGGDGDNSYLPWESGTSGSNGNTSITGGAGTDEVFLLDKKSAYTLSSICNQAKCQITQGTVKLVLANIEKLIFPDGVVYLR